MLAAATAASHCWGCRSYRWCVRCSAAPMLRVGHSSTAISSIPLRFYHTARTNFCCTQNSSRPQDYLNSRSRWKRQEANSPNLDDDKSVHKTTPRLKRRAHLTDQLEPPRQRTELGGLCVSSSGWLRWLNIWRGTVLSPRVERWVSIDILLQISGHRGKVRT